MRWSVPIATERVRAFSAAIFACVKSGTPSFSSSSSEAYLASARRLRGLPKIHRQSLSAEVRAASKGSPPSSEAKGSSRRRLPGMLAMWHRGAAQRACSAVAGQGPSS